MSKKISLTLSGIEHATFPKNVLELGSLLFWDVMLHHWLDGVRSFETPYWLTVECLTLNCRSVLVFGVQAYKASDVKLTKSDNKMSA
jgi:hypothetical protein